MARRYYQLPSLTGLNAFDACARHGSFTAAAVELGVTLGAVSRQIKALEAENAALRADLRGQSVYMRGAARTVRALAIASHAPRPAGEAVDATNVHYLWSGGPAAQSPGPAIDALNGVADDLVSFASVADRAFCGGAGRSGRARSIGVE